MLLKKKKRLDACHIMGVSTLIPATESIEEISFHWKTISHIIFFILNNEKVNFKLINEHKFKQAGYRPVWLHLIATIIVGEGHA
jgi:hypothetical protein